MKLKKIVCLLGIIMLINSCTRNFNQIKGDKNLIRSDKVTGNFNAIHLLCFADVKVHKAETNRIVIETDSNLLQFVDVKVENEELKIDVKSTNVFLNFTSLNIDIYTPDIDKITLVSSGDIRFIDKFYSKDLEVKINGSGDLEIQNKVQNAKMKITGSGNITGNLECDSLEASINGSGDLILNGKTFQMNIKIVESGNFIGDNFETENIWAIVYGSGNIYIWAKSYLNANIFGSGNIIVKGNPQIESQVSGSGRVRREY